MRIQWVILALHWKQCLAHRTECLLNKLSQEKGFFSGSVVKSLPANARNMGSISGLGRSPGEQNGNPLQYSCLGNPMDREAWWATVYGLAKESGMTWQLQQRVSQEKPFVSIWYDFDWYRDMPWLHFILIAHHNGRKGFVF